MFFLNVYCGYSVLKKDIFPTSFRNIWWFINTIYVLFHIPFFNHILMWCWYTPASSSQQPSYDTTGISKKIFLFLTKFFLGTINCDKPPVIMKQITLIKPFRGPRDLPVLTLLCNVIQRPIQSDMNQWRPFPL